MPQTVDPPVMTDQALSVILFEAEAREWDRFVEGAPHGTFCHVAGWRDVMADVLGHECLYNVALNESGTWQGVLPMVRVKSRVFGHYLVSMPFLNYGGPLGTPAAQARLANHAAEQARRLGADLLELRTRHDVACDLHVSRRKVTMLLDLPRSPDELWEKTIPAKRRRQIRRARLENMTVTFGADQVDSFYEVFARNQRDLGTPVLPRRLFERLATSFGDRVVFGVAFGHGRPLASACGFVWGDEFEITWVASVREFDAKMPIMLLYWSFMEEMQRRGVAVFNFGRCTPGGGTHEFKRQWGSAEVPLPWLQWSPSGVAATPTADRPLLRAATALWSRIPLAVANRLGPRIARQLP